MGARIGVGALSLLSHQVQGGGRLTEPIRASETHSLQPGTSAWANFGGIRPETEEETA